MSQKIRLLLDESRKIDVGPIFNKNGKMDESKVTIGMCGSLSKRKNPDLFCRIAEKFPNYNFLWIGGKEDFKITPSNLYHVKEVETPYSYYFKIDHFVLFSEEDPCPYVVLENIFLNRSVIVFEENIFTIHDPRVCKTVPGSISEENLIKTIPSLCSEKFIENECESLGRDYIINNFSYPTIVLDYIKQNYDIQPKSTSGISSFIQNCRLFSKRNF